MKLGVKSDLAEPVKSEEAIVPEQKPSSFSLKEDAQSLKPVITVYGQKGSGKTAFAFAFTGSKVVLCFDRKAANIKASMYQSDKDIRVFDCIQYYSSDVPNIEESAKMTYDLIKQLIVSLHGNAPDWVIFDGLNVYSEIAEMVMRKNNGLMPFEGFANRNLWKERNKYIDQMHRMCYNLAKKGVVYTCYSDKDEIIKDGELQLKVDVPKYTDTVLRETDVVVQTYSEKEKDGRVFFAEVHSSKFPDILRTGEVLNMTNLLKEKRRIW